jgi:transcriptional regulator with PAS, ATPase and Fis domain
VQKGKFREDLYYRLNTVPLKVPSLRERKEDIYLIFRKFISDFSVKYRSPLVQLNEEARGLLESYKWPGNVRQLRNLAEQIAVLENDKKEIDAHSLLKYLPYEQAVSELPMRLGTNNSENDFSERDILYKVLFDMKKDLMDLKKVVVDLLQHSENTNEYLSNNTGLINKLYQDVHAVDEDGNTLQLPVNVNQSNYNFDHPVIEEVEETLSLEEKEIDFIRKALKKHKGKRKYAALELGISERTLYRKIKEYDLNL